MHLYKTSILPAECLFSLRSFDRPKTFTWHESPKTHCDTVPRFFRQSILFSPFLPHSYSSSPTLHLVFSRTSRGGLLAAVSPSGIKTKIDKPFVSARARARAHVSLYSFATVVSLSYIPFSARNRDGNLGSSPVKQLTFERGYLATWPSVL